MKFKQFSHNEIYCWSTSSSLSLSIFLFLFLSIFQRVNRERERAKERILCMISTHNTRTEFRTHPRECVHTWMSIMLTITRSLTHSLFPHSFSLLLSLSLSLSASLLLSLSLFFLSRKCKRFFLLFPFPSLLNVMRQKWERERERKRVRERMIGKRKGLFDPRLNSSRYSLPLSLSVLSVCSFFLFCLSHSPKEEEERMWERGRKWPEGEKCDNRRTSNDTNRRMDTRNGNDIFTLIVISCLWIQFFPSSRFLLLSPFFLPLLFLSLLSLSLSFSLSLRERERGKKGERVRDNRYRNKTIFWCILPFLRSISSSIRTRYSFLWYFPSAFDTFTSSWYIPPPSYICQVLYDSSSISRRSEWWSVTVHLILFLIQVLLEDGVKYRYRSR